MGIRPWCITFCGLALTGGSSAAQLESDPAEIRAALLPLPMSLRAHATVLGRGPDGRLVRLRNGQNGLICEAQDPAVKAMRLFCYQESMLPLRERRQDLLVRGHSAAEAAEILETEVSRGDLTAPQAATAYLLRGPAGCLHPESGTLCAEASLVYMIYTPGMTTSTLGLPLEREDQAPYMHAEGTVWSHIMVEPPAPATTRLDGSDRQNAAALEALPNELKEGAKGYLMDEEAEIALARSAAPPEISADATVKVLRRTGFAVAVEGTNDFVCLVLRSWGNPTFAAAALYEPAVRIPECYNSVAVQTMLPIQELRHRLGLDGMAAEEIKAAVSQGILDGRLLLPEKMALGYMMSNAMALGSGGAVEPHVMIYVTGYSRNDTGGIGWGIGPSTFIEGRPYVEDGWGVFVSLAIPTKEGYDPVRR